MVGATALEEVAQEGGERISRAIGQKKTDMVIAELRGVRCVPAGQAAKLVVKGLTEGLKGLGLGVAKVHPFTSSGPHGGGRRPCVRVVAGVGRRVQALERLEGGRDGRHDGSAIQQVHSPGILPFPHPVEKVNTYACSGRRRSRMCTASPKLLRLPEQLPLALGESTEAAVEIQRRAMDRRWSRKATPAATPSTLTGTTALASLGKVAAERRRLGEQQARHEGKELESARAVQRGRRTARHGGHVHPEGGKLPFKDRVRGEAHE